MELTLNDIQEYLGQTGKKQGDEIVFGCGICQLSGGDAHSDNLKWNTKKNILYCFKDSEHSKIIMSEIMKKKHEAKRMENKEIPAYIKNQEKYLYYMELCNNALLGTLTKDWIDAVNEQDMFEVNEYNFYLDLINSDNAQKARAYLKEQRGINTSTIEQTGLGFDFKARKWVIPIFDISCNLVGFEYRLADFKNKKIWREKGTPSCLARVYGTGKKAIIHEGFMDSFCTVQMLEEKGTLNDYSIFTTSSGVASVLKIIPELQFNKYKNIYLLLDCDNAGDKATQEVIEKYPFIIDIRKMLKDSNCKDVNQYMLKKEV